MDEQQMSQLKALPFPAFVYFDMGDGFELTKLETDMFAPGGASYVLTYDNSMGGIIKIFGCAGGVGDIPAGVRQVEFSSMLYGRGTVEIYEAGSEEGFSFRSRWISDWRPGSYYSFAGENLEERFINKIVDGLMELE
ncbi:hypothetical protein IJT93_01195 [bacterium]|nr:hypothetical protein [bacterium]